MESAQRSHPSRVQYPSWTCPAFSLGNRIPKHHAFRQAQNLGARFSPFSSSPSKRLGDGTTARSDPAGPAQVLPCCPSVLRCPPPTHCQLPVLVRGGGPIGHSNDMTLASRMGSMASGEKLHQCLRLRPTPPPKAELPTGFVAWAKSCEK